MGYAGTRLLFKLCSGTHGLNEELGRHRGREGKCMCNLCGEDCESVGHFLWNCLIYSERRALFLEHLKKNLEKEFKHFKNCGGKGITLICTMQTIDLSFFVSISEGDPDPLYWYQKCRDEAAECVKE